MSETFIFRNFDLIVEVKTYIVKKTIKFVSYFSLICKKGIPISDEAWKRFFYLLLLKIVLMVFHVPCISSLNYKYNFIIMFLAKVKRILFKNSVICFKLIFCVLNIGGIWISHFMFLYKLSLNWIDRIIPCVIH